MQLTNSLLHALLVASDESYHPGPIGDPLGAPDMTNSPPNPPTPTTSPGMPGSWSGDLTGWTVAKTYTDSGTGFSATIYEKDDGLGDGKSNYIVACRGTRGVNAQDWYQNLNYGWGDFSSSTAQQMMSLLTSQSFVDTTNQICFTGHSLGGGLAQYAAYQYVDVLEAAQVPPSVLQNDVSVVAFNTMGAVAGLTANYASLATGTGRAYNANLMSGITCQYYNTTNDIIHLLGGGNLNDVGGRNDYLLPVYNTSNPPYALGFLSAHRISTGLYAAFDQNSTLDFSNAPKAPVAPLNIPSAQAIAAIVSGIADVDPTYDAEAGARLLAGVIAAFGLASTIDTYKVANMFVQSWVADGTVPPAAAIPLSLTGTLAAQTLAEAPPVVAVAVEAFALAQVLNILDTGPTSSMFSSANFTTAMSYVSQIENTFGTLLNPSFSQIATGASNILSAYAGQQRQLIDFSASVVQRLVQMEENASIVLVPPIEDPGGDIPMMEGTITLHLSDLLNLITSDPNWISHSIGDVAQWASAANEDVAKALVGYTSWLFSEAKSAEASTDAFVVSVAQQIASAVQDVLQSAGNAFVDFVKKFGTATQTWIESLSDSVRRQIIEEFNNLISSTGSTPTANPATSSWTDFMNGLLYAGEEGGLAAQDLVVLPGTGTNPFSNPSYSNSGLTPQTISLTTDQTDTLSVFLAEPAAGSQQVHIALGGTGASGVEVLDASGNPVVQNADGSYTITVGSGQSGATFQLYAPGTVASGTLTLTATLVDSTGAPTSAAQNDVNVNLVPAVPITTASVIAGTAQMDTVTGLAYTLYAGDGAADLISVGGGINSVLGGAGDDIIIGSDAQNVIVAGSGNSEIYAGQPVDLPTAITNGANASAATGLQGDFIGVGDGNNTIVGSNGNDAIFVGQGSNLIVLGPGTNTVIGGTETSSAQLNWSVGPLANGVLPIANIFNSNPGFATTVPYEGNSDTSGVAVGVGNDTIYAGAGSDLIELSNGNNYVQLGSGSSSVYGGMGQNTIFAGSGNSLVLGGGGSDYIDGQSGSHLLIGRGGNNTIIGGSGNDTIWAGGDDTNWATSETGSNSVYGGSGNDQIAGAGGSDTLIAGTGNSSIYGGDGTESIVGGSGNDLLVGGTGNDTIIADGAGTDTLEGGASAGSTTYIYGGAGVDSITGDAGTDVMYAGDGGTSSTLATSVFAGSGSATIYGGTGVDALVGGSGSDVIYAGDGGSAAAGATSVEAGAGPTTIYGGAGLDIIQGGSGSDVLYAGDGGTDASPTTVLGGDGVATLYGGAGSCLLSAISQNPSGGTTGNPDDVLIAGSGNSTLIGYGSDTLQTGSGNELLQNDGGNLSIVVNANYAGDTIAFGAGDSGTNSLQFASGIAPTDFSVSATVDSTNTPYLVLSSATGTLYVADGLTGGIGSISFADAPAIGLQQLIQQTNSGPQVITEIGGNLNFSGDNGAAVSAGIFGNDTISAWGNNDTLTSTIYGTVIYAGGNSASVVGGAGSDTITAAGANDTVLAGSGSVSITAAAANDSIQAGAGSDTIIVNGSGDTVVAGTGNDSIVVNGSADSIVAGSGSDTIVVNGSNDTIAGGSGTGTFVVNDASAVITVQPGLGSDTVLSSVSYTLSNYVKALTLTGSANLTATSNATGAVLTGNAGNDTLIGGSNRDTLIAGSGVDTLIGGSGPYGAVPDTFVINNVNDVIQLPANAGADTVESSVSYTMIAGVDTLTLTGSADVAGTGNSDASNIITGNAGNDTLTAGSGRDTLAAGSGLATLIGGTGADEFDINNVGDVIQLAATATNDTVVSSVSYSMANGVDTLTLTGTGNLTATGNSDASNVITANLGADSLVAGSGSDVLYADTVFGAGADTLVAGSGNDTFFGTSGATYVFNSGFGTSEIRQPSSQGSIEFGAGISASNLTLSAVAGYDGLPALLIQDGTGAIKVDDAFAGSNMSYSFSDGSSLTLDQLLTQGTVTSSTVTGSSGNLILLGGNAVSIQGGSGSDTIYGVGSNDTLVAGTGSQQLYALGANEVLVATLGNDTLWGGSGDDTLVGGTGASTLNGGQGNDAYELTPGGTVTINPGSGATSAIILPAGMAFTDFTSFASGQDLIIQSITGGTAAIIKGYFNLANPDGWFLESTVSGLLTIPTWSATQATSAASYAAEEAALLSSAQAQLTAELNALGSRGGTLGSLIDEAYNLAHPQPTYTYTFGGVVQQALAVSGGTLAAPSSEAETYQYQTFTQNQTVTTQTPAFSVGSGYGGYGGGTQYFVPLSQLFPPGVSGVQTPPGVTVSAPTTVNGVAGVYAGLPSVQGLTSTSYTTTTTTVTFTYTQTQATRTFTEYAITGDSGNDVITTTSPFVGTVVLGDGNNYVNLGTKSQTETDWFTGGSYQSSNVFYFYPIQPGAYIQAGNGNDTIIGTDGDDTIVAGLGYDSLDGGRGGDTYYVPMQGYSTDVITDSGRTDLFYDAYVTQPAAMSVVEPQGYYDITPSPIVYPVDKLILPSGTTLANLKYRVFQDPYDSTQQMLQIISGTSTVLISFAAPESIATGTLSNPGSSNELEPPPLWIGPGMTANAQLGVDQVQFGDGTTMSLSQLISQASLLPNDFNPIVTLLNPVIAAGTSIAASSLFTASDTVDNTITWYKFSNSGTGGGTFVLNGQAQAVGQSFMVNASQLANVSYVAGSTTGVADTIQISAFDQAVWSPTVSATVSPGAAVAAAPVNSAGSPSAPVVALNSTAAGAASVAASVAGTAAATSFAGMAAVGMPTGTGSIAAATPSPGLPTLFAGAAAGALSQPVVTLQDLQNASSALRPASTVPAVGRPVISGGHPQHRAILGVADRIANGWLQAHRAPEAALRGIVGESAGGLHGEDFDTDGALPSASFAAMERKFSPLGMGQENVGWQGSGTLRKASL
ncbi:MAG: DUF2974 domain-containing protein [Burkholderiaceae bacterium]|nr:DUF2974 domain-containing protein [Burkholderiaceae bacterium]